MAGQLVLPDVGIGIIRKNHLYTSSDNL